MVSPRDGDHTGTMVASHTSVTLLAGKPLLMQDLHPARSVIEGQHRRTVRDTLILASLDLEPTKTISASSHVVS